MKIDSSESSYLLILSNKQKIEDGISKLLIDYFSSFCSYINIS